MISFPTTTAGEVWSGEETGRQQHPHHHLVRGVGVWWGCRKLDPAGGEISEAVRRPRLKIQAGCRPTIGGAS
jgi:hypothetical protein